MESLLVQAQLMLAFFLAVSGKVWQQAADGQWFTPSGTAHFCPIIMLLTVGKYSWVRNETSIKKEMKSFEPQTFVI